MSRPIGLLNVLLAEGLNLGLRKMAETTNAMITGSSHALPAGMLKAKP
jgi:hypothetical protein